MNEEISQFFKPNKEQAAALRKLGLATLGDLLHHFPVRYGSMGVVKRIAEAIEGEQVTFFGKVRNLKTGKAFVSKIAMAEAMIEDESGSIKAVWFHQPYIAKMVSEGSFVRIEGKVTMRRRKNELYLSNPSIDMIPSLPANVGSSLFGEGGAGLGLYPIYSESRGLTSNWIYYSIQKIFKTKAFDEIVDPIPQEILDRYNLPSLHTALIWIHAPQKESDAIAARKRFAFEEVFFIQLDKQRERARQAAEPAFKIEQTEKELAAFESRFPFKPTSAQSKAIDSILTDFKKGTAMSRLLEGDVGSGKTFVAAATVFAAISSKPIGKNFGRLQAAYMAPTEILARQHFESFISFFKHMPVQIGLMTGSGCLKFPSKVDPKGYTNISRAQLIKWTKSGEIDILIGTHALIQKSVEFKNLAYVVIDEQHRFGTEQRKRLSRKHGTREDFEKNFLRKDKDKVMIDQPLPHLLSMTATPIPRTLALTVYGDLDLTVLDQMPAGRKPVITEIVPADERKRKAIYEKIRAELASGRQAYVICPRINEPDPSKEQALLARSVEEEAKHLKRDIFQNYEIAVLHSKMKPADKEAVMKRFEDHDIDILVSTSVVEVGVNVPNATVMLIEGGERFGLAQLHQLRGRVIRSNHQAYCFVFAETKSQKTVDRLEALRTAKNGFELAELDLKLRGSGELYGRRQWGLSDVAMEAIRNLKMVEAARTEAQKLVEEDMELAHFPLLKQELESREAIHFE
jgi:ATP-dependent DNA helicase RecG